MPEGEGIFHEQFDGRAEVVEEDVKDERLFLACRDGQKGACAEFHTKWYAQVAEQLRTMGADSTGLDVGKITGIIMDRLMYQPISTYERSKGARFSAWLYQVVKNQFLNEIRANQRAHHYERQGEEALERRQPNPEELHLRKELEEKIAEAIASLPEDQRRVFALFEFDRVPYLEIAAREGIPIGTVGKRISLARTKLKQVLGPLYNEFRESH